MPLINNTQRGNAMSGFRPKTAQIWLLVGGGYLLKDKTLSLEFYPRITNGNRVLVQFSIDDFKLEVDNNYCN